MNKKTEQQQESENKEAARRSEKAGLFHFTKDMIAALAMALVAIVYVIQAFKIPSGSMENSLLIGDFLLGLKFIYGAPVLPYMYTKLPGIADPKPGDVIIFKYPGLDRKDYIKRCVAGPGQTIESHGMTLTVDGRTLQLPPKGQYIHNGQLDPRITNFDELRVPKKGDTLVIKPDMPVRQFLFYKHLIKQENPRHSVQTEYQLYVNGEFANSRKVILFGYYEIPFARINFDSSLFESRLPFDNWINIDEVLKQVVSQFPESEKTIDKFMKLDNKKVARYIVKYDNYFMMGDNRDNSTDSRYWGFLNRNFIKAKAFILYFSWDKDVPLWELPVKIRWNRIGKLIRAWDGGGTWK